MTHHRKPWQVTESASPEALSLLAKAVPNLPKSYLDFLAIGNGGEVEMPEPIFNLCLESAESALDYWESGSYTIDNAFVFGGTGGGTYFAFDFQSPEPFSVIAFDPISPDDSKKTGAPDFSTFVSMAMKPN